MTSKGDILLPIEHRKPGYGAVDSTTTNTVIYCVHGKPKTACCDDDNNGSPSSDIQISKLPTGTQLHCHVPRRDGIDKKARTKLIIASVLCVTFMIIEIVGGVLSNSLAIASDAAHLLTDFAGFMISLFAIYIAGRPSTQRLSFGWYRAEVIGALTSVLLIWVITGILVMLAVQRVVTGDYEVDPTIMLITSLVGLGANLIMACSLHQHAHSRTAEGGIDLDSHRNINVHAAFIHVLGDILQSVGVFIAALVIYFRPDWKIADPICTFLFSVLVMFTTFAIIRDALLVLMEATPKYLDYTEIMETLLQIPGVIRVHSLRIWALSISKTALAAHLAIDISANPEQILKDATRTVHTKYNFFETTIQIEMYQPEMEDCGQCLNPPK